MAVSDLYHRLPLKEGCRTIRILHVNSCSGPADDDGLIVSQLRLVNLDENPSYAALSYVWGKDTPQSNQHIVKCSGISLPVTQNCYSALLNLRKKLGCFSIWIDAISLNQDKQVLDWGLPSGVQPSPGLRLVQTSLDLPCSYP